MDLVKSMASRIEECILPITDGQSNISFTLQILLYKLKEKGVRYLSQESVSSTQRLMAILNKHRKKLNPEAQQACKCL